MLILLLISLALLLWFIDRELDTRESHAPTTLHGCCPECNRDVESGWLLCPDCRCILRSCCSACGKVHDRWVRFCPWCAEPHLQPAEMKGLYAQSE